MLKKTFLIVTLLVTAFTFSQETQQKNTDSIYFNALDLYKNKKYTSSLQLTNEGLEIAPEYHDIRILRVRNNWALANIKEAENDIRYLLEKAPEYPSVKDLALRQVNYFENKERSIVFIDDLQEVFGSDPKMQVLKASLLLKVGERQKARALALSLFRNNALDSDLRYTLQNILNRTVSTEIGINYQYINFSEDYSRNEPWHTVSGEFLQYFNRTAVIARVTRADRSFDQGFLYELESYPVFSDKVYAFVNAGVSDGRLFPDFRGSASLFVNLFRGFELETGGRLLHFSDQDYFTGIVGLTTYQGRFYLNGRSFLGPKRLDRLIQNYQFNIRYYFSSIDDYLFGRFGSGISPDETTIFTQVQENPVLDAYYFNVGWNKTIGIHHIIQVGAGYLYEDLSQNNQGYQFLGNVSYRYRF
ncbi:YaiO family outer membrane beta-barrel protein [Christiangramia sabulilitoris]|nr:YaiO family outer membrane beta-barrel protein [Christiangramia sabulilitoris]